MKVLISGATGFLGSHLATHLHIQDHQVGCLRRPGSALPASLTGFPNWNADDGGNGFKKALNEFRPDVVVHLAALYVAEHHPEDIAPLIRANIEYGAHLLEAMREAGCTAMVYAGTSWQHYRGEPYCPANLYAATKQAFSTLADYYRDAAGLRLLELHLYDSYGPNDPRKKLIEQLQDRARNGIPLPMSNGEQRIHLLHIDDLICGLAQACLQVLRFLPGHRALYRLPSPATISLRDLVAQFNEANPKQPVQVIWGDLPYRKREIFTPWEEGEVLPGWAPRITLAKGLRDICR
jgi:nucleoside-diphosphate-sugar epimerase